MGGWIVKFLGTLFGLLIPPEDADPGHVRTYRWAVSSMLVGIYLVVGLWVLVAVGAIPAVSAGIAWVSDVEKIKVEMAQKQAFTALRIKTIQTLLVRNALKQSLHDACSAISNNNQAALDAANNDLDVMSEQYMQLTGRPYVRPPCDVVLISSPK